MAWEDVYEGANATNIQNFKELFKPYNSARVPIFKIVIIHALCQIRLHHCHRSMPSWPFLSLQEAAVIGAMGYVGWSLGPCQIHIFELNRPNPHFHRLNYLNLHSCWTMVTMGHQGTPVRTATPTPWASALGPCSRAVARWWAAGRPSAASRMWTCAMAAAWVESGNNYIVTMYSCSCLCQSTCLKIL